MKKSMDMVAAAQAVKDRLTIVDVVGRYVSLIPAGGNRFKASCPFHSETQPSFSVDLDRGSFYCFGCKVAGDIFEFYSKYHGLSFKESLEQLAQEVGVPLRGLRAGSGFNAGQEARKRALKQHDLASAHFRENLRGAQGKMCREYLAGRQLDEKLIGSFELGWSLDDWQDLGSFLQRAGYSREQGVAAGLLKKNESGHSYDFFRSRLMFPIKNLSGQTIAFGGRIIGNEDTAKYINSPDSVLYKKSGHLYGLVQARRAVSAQKSVLLTEGYMDVLTLHQFGYQNACGILGTALTLEHLTRLRGLTSQLELVFDGDRAGRAAALASAEIILQHGLHCRIVTLPDDPLAKDIDLLLKNHGKEAFEALRAKAPDGLNYCMRVLNGNFAAREALAWVKKFFEGLEQPEFASRYISQLAQGLGLEESSIRKEVEWNKTSKGHSRNKEETPPVSQEWRKDEVFLAFALRSPRRIPDLERYGLRFVLESPRGAALWEALCSLDIREVEENIFWALNEEDRQFCLYCRMADFSLDEAAEERECRSLCARIDQLAQDKNRKAHRQVLAAVRGLNAPSLRESSEGDPLRDDIDEMLRAYNHAARECIRKDHE